MFQKPFWFAKVLLKMTCCLLKNEHICRAVYISRQPLFITTGLGDWVQSLVMQGYTYAHHCKFTGTSACHIHYVLEISQAWVLGFGTCVKQGFKAHLGFLKQWKYVLLWHSLNEPFCRIYDRVDKEYVWHLTFVLLCYDCFCPPITDN